MEHDTETYSDCPGPLPDGYLSHGISLQPGADGIHRLAAVRHDGREAIEIFRVDARGPHPVLTWIGCLLEPDGERVDFNSVVWLPGGGFAVTGFMTDNVWEWTRTGAGRRSQAPRTSTPPTGSRPPPTAGGSTSGPTVD